MKTHRFCPNCAKPLIKAMSKTHDFECHACELAFNRSETLRLKERQSKINYYRRLHKYGIAVPSYKKAHTRRKNKKYRIAYQKDTLKKNNQSYDSQYNLHTSDVYKANSFINLIENTRSTVQPKVGDRLRLTTEHGNYYHRAHIDEVNGDSLNICEQPQIPFIFRRKNGISCSTSGGAWCNIPIEKVRYIGKEKKFFCDWGHVGACGNGAIYFEAEVSVWEYTEPNLKYPGYTTKDWRRYYVWECKDPSDGYKYTTGDGIAWRTKEDLEAFIKKFKGVTFPGNYERQFLLWCYHDQQINTHTKEKWDELSLPISKAYINGERDVKIQYDDETHILYHYYYFENIYGK